MKVSFEWIKEYFDEELKLNDVCDKLTISGTKVENVESNKIEVKNIVTGLIEEIKPHPDAEKLVVCSVNIGESYVQIVTGAKNMKEGDIVPVALHGAILADGTKIKKGKLRGVESQGMMCSEEELGLCDHADGLMILKDVPIGENIVNVLDSGQEIVEFEITSNRPDCLGILGIAREIKAIYGFDLKNPKFDFKYSGCKDINDLLSVDVQNKDCRRYSARVIENLKICDSPKFIQDRLIASGIRPINNIVDLTNYVMLEIGQPMHAFDYNVVSNSKIIVGNTINGDKFITLDGIERELDDSIICIKDSEKVLALGGIIGGENSKVNDDTKRIILESANFKFDVIRRSSRKLNLRSESSLRFEKNIDDNLTLIALNRFCSLVEELSYGDVVNGTIDIINESYERVNIEVTPQYINKFLGTDISKDSIIKIFKNLDMEVKEDNELLIVTPPTFRRDIFIKEDLAEEIARIYGYDQIKEEDLKSVSQEIGKTKKQKFIDNILNTMISLGFSQSMSYSFYSPRSFDKMNLEKDNELRDAITIRNPLGEDYSVMRTTMVPSMIEALYRNISYSNSEACIFDIGKTYGRGNDGKILENNVLAMGMYGKNFDYFTIKGVIESLFEHIGITFMLEREGEVFYHPGKSARIVLGKNVLGKFGSIHPYVLRNYDAKVELFICEVYLDKIFNFYKSDKKYKQIPKYPSVTFDLNVVVDEDVLVQDIEKIIKSKSGNILESLNIFDIYRGSQVPEGKKSVSYSIIFRDRSKTLNDKEINKLIEIILNALKLSLGAELRK